ncbi:hypothetical protein [Marinifilum sp. D714]|uniref:hypothetical protein n=1 Tax=Marinifilum sp. D714 TaxID=2937523 RepID=UPI0027BB94C5|nr:hypothetical protein [Marinifilum sp. D714]MDQ2178820.1 hypothetical protein [Marinifilum sp. D714]
MKLPILKIENSDLNEFINYWSELYSYPLESLYNERIYKKKFDAEDLLQLFIWKNGMKLSAGKQKSFEDKVLSKRDIINDLKSKQNLGINEFQKHFNNLSAVWKIFLLHIIRPNKYPIYDQHINRAFNYIHGFDYQNISANSMTNNSKEEFYFNTYLEFIESLNGIDLKKMDEAFFAFGQFINTKTYVQIVN